MTTSQSFQAGDLLSVVSDDGRFGIVKVLAADAQGLHVRFYQQRFDARPLAVEPEALTLGSMFDAHSPFSIGHVALSHRAFAGWQGHRISGGTVADDELAGYREWVDADGGYF